MATWIQMLANSYFVYWHCLISVDFLMSLTSSDPSHPGGQWHSTQIQAVPRRAGAHLTADLKVAEGHQAGEAVRFHFLIHYAPLHMCSCSCCEFYGALSSSSTGQMDLVLLTTHSWAVVFIDICQSQTLILQQTVAVQLNAIDLW